MNPEQRDTRLLQTGDRVGLKFNSGWLFLQVIGTEYVELKPWILMNENQNRAAIAPQTAGYDADEIQDPLSRDLLEPNKDRRDEVFQILYGVAPSRMQVFRLYGRNRNTALENYDAPGDPAAYLNGFDSPYDNPSSVSELFYVNAMSPLRLQAYNPMDEAKEARLSFHVNKLRYNVITNENLMKAMLQGQTPAKLTMMGDGVSNSDELDVPDWINEAFGDNIYSTNEILTYNGGSSGSGGSNPQQGPLQQNILSGGTGQ